MKDEISDTLAWAIGKILEVNAVVTGTFETVDKFFNFRLRMIDVGSGSILNAYSAHVQIDQFVASLSGVPVPAPTSTTTSTSPASYVYQDFTSAQRFGTWAINQFILPGLGSFIIMKDRNGGLFQLFFGGAGVALIIGGYAKGLTTYEVGEWGEPVEKENKSAKAMVVIGYMFGITCELYNIVRSANYHKPNYRTSSIIDPGAWNIGVLPGKDGIEQVSLSYTMRY